MICDFVFDYCTRRKTSALYMISATQILPIALTIVSHVSNAFSRRNSYLPYGDDGEKRIVSMQLRCL